MSSGPMKGVECIPLSLCDRGIGWNVVRRSPLSGTPECFMLAADFFTTPLALVINVTEFRIIDIFQLPVVENERVSRIVKQVGRFEHSQGE